MMQLGVGVKRVLNAVKAVVSKTCQLLSSINIDRIPPAQVVLLGYISYIVFGWLLLSLSAAQRIGGIGTLDHLFIAVSAVSTTGLTTIDVGSSYSFFGQAIIMVLIQLGGIGYMTVGSFVILSRHVDVSAARTGVLKTVFSLPESFSVPEFIRGVIAFTLVIESLGALMLYSVFRQAGVDNAVWMAIFHSVSAFCTAGFSLFKTGFEPFTGNFWLNLVIGVLSYLGAVGFIVCLDYWRAWRRPQYQITLTSRIIVRTTVFLSVIGMFLLFVADPTLARLSPDKRLLASFFQCMTAMTTVGFNTVPIAALSKASILLLVVLMVVGASPSGTGGGVKSTTFSAIFGVMRSAVMGEKEVRFWGGKVPLERLWFAVASLGFYITVLVIGSYLLELTEPTGFVENVFEVASALGTVGLSMGITAALSPIGKIIIIFLMFCGRLGPLTFGVALFARSGRSRPATDNDLAI